MVLAYLILAIVRQQTLPLKVAPVSHYQWHGNGGYGMPAARDSPPYNRRRTDKPRVPTDLLTAL